MVGVLLNVIDGMMDGMLVTDGILFGVFVLIGTEDGDDVTAFTGNKYVANGEGVIRIVSVGSPAMQDERIIAVLKTTVAINRFIKRLSQFNFTFATVAPNAPAKMRRAGQDHFRDQDHPRDEYNPF